MSKNILRGYPTPPKDCYKVYVRSCTYNQAPYIEDCLNGVAMQKTGFPFIHHVIDDCSTDGEQEVIKAWIERECDLDNAEYYDNDICTITLAKHKSNLNYTIAAYFLKRNMYGNPQKRELYKLWRDVCPYEAICEGDDYWIDPQKIYKQAKYLDEHFDYTLVGTNGLVVWEELYNSPSYFSQEKYEKNFSLSELSQTWAFPTASLFYKKTVVENYPEWTKKIYSGDQALILISASKGNVHYFPDLTCIYRQSVKNIYSASAKYGVNLDGRIFVRQQQLLLLEEFSSWTQQKYSSELRVAINNKKKNIKYLKYRKISKLLPYLLMPFFAFGKKKRK